jgi:L-lactate dehydrogenase complex protein LldF
MTEFVPAPPPLGRAVRGTTDRLVAGRLRALAALPDAAAARARARAARERAVSNLSASLERFEASARDAGITVHHAENAAAAVRIVTAILDAADARRIVKSKSMATEEIRLREALEHGGREVVETDLGEWIVQLAGQMPSHIIVPAVHLPRQRIRALLSAVAGRDLGAETPALAGFARAHLRQRFLEAEAGISGGNLLIAETGGLMIVSNEGNARMCTTLPRLHVAVVGIEKVVGTVAEALDVLAVLPRSATGQAITQYVSFLQGPRRAGEPPGDGPEELHVVLLDNGRSRLVGTPAEELLYCIRCGACLNVCPVYRTMGGHGYSSVYPGPIGAALTPRLTQGREGADLPWASSLCGACREACPVGIQLDDQLIALRAEHPKPLPERIAMRAFAGVASRPAAFSAALRVARIVLGGAPSDRLPGPLDRWTRGRRIAGIAPLRRHARLGPRGSAPPAPPPAAAPPPCAAPPPSDLASAFAAAWQAQGGTARVVVHAELEAAVHDAVGAGPVSADPVLAGLVDDLPQATAMEAAVGLVWAPAAAAQTGTLVLPSGAGTERRRSLLPPRAVFIVDEVAIAADLPAAFGAAGLLPPPAPRPAAVTLVSGPSRSSDIENDLVIGVHGPGEAIAIVVRDPTAAGA